MNRKEARKRIIIAILTVVITGCGGHVIDSGKQVDVGAGATGGGGTSGGMGPSGAAGVDVSACSCIAGECAPGTQSVRVSGQCCPVCQPCGFAICPSGPACGPDEQPVTLAGQCCPTSCGRTAPVEAGACPLTLPPACQMGDTCAPDWATALSWYPRCNPAELGTHLVRCGSYDAVTSRGVDTSESFFYDAAGKLVGHQYFGASGVGQCESYEPSFTAPPDVGTCVPLDGCSMDAGTVAPRADAGACDFMFSVTTVTANDRYAPHNVGAIWITTSFGQFVKTLDLWGYLFTSSATAWEASGGNAVDAVTEATRPAHGPMEAHWNCTDAAHSAVQNGDYEVCVTFAEQPTIMPTLSREACVPFRVGIGPLDTRAPDQPNFVSMHVVSREAP